MDLKGVTLVEMQERKSSARNARIQRYFIVVNEEAYLHVVINSGNCILCTFDIKQSVDLIFLSPVFKVKKNKFNLGIIKFNNLSNIVNQKSVVLGGVNKTNLNFFKNLNCKNFASISYFNHMVN